jgi:hypothetical protein
VGEEQSQSFQLSFNPSLKVDFQGSLLTSDAGLLLVRELDERWGLSELISEHLTDSRGKNTQLPMADLLRQAVYGRSAGYEDVNDAERLWRRLALPKRIESWSLTSLQQRLVKTCGRVVKRARYYWLLLAEGHRTRRRREAMLSRIAPLPLETG